VTVSDVLAFQLSDTLWGSGVGTAVPVKFTPLTEVALTDTDAVGGVNVYPDLLTATTYRPFGRLPKLYFPKASVVAEPETFPESVRFVAADPLTVPEILYVFVGGGAA
jgi:hypothetical protein